MTMTYEEAHDSLLSCIIGLVSTEDLHHIKATLNDYPNDLLEDYYKRALEDHCKMIMYNNPFDQ